MSYKAIILGASTGGPSALRTILKNIPKNFPIPIIIVQRIPPGLFAESLAEALDEASDIKVRILKEEDTIQQNEAVLIPGGFNITFQGGGNKIKLIPGDDPENSPSISYTIGQTQAFFKEPIILSILTGICLDDNLTSESKKLKEQQGFIIVQSPDSCFIEDLPQTIIQENLADKVIALDKMGEEINSLCL